jgi:hypothetical protein
MRRNLLRIVVTSALAAVPIASFAQTSGEAAKGAQSAAPDPAAPAGSMENRYGRSPRCDSLSGADKEQCLRDEAEKTQGSQPDDKSAQGSAGAGGSSPEKPATEGEAAKSPSEVAPSDSGSPGTR